MKRSDFLKKLGIGFGVVVIAPHVVSDISNKEKDYTTSSGTRRIHEESLYYETLSNLHKYNVVTSRESVYKLQEGDILSFSGNGVTARGVVRGFEEKDIIIIAEYRGL